MPRTKGCTEVSQFMRGRVIGMHESGKSERAIAQIMDLTKSTVHNIITRFHQTGSCDVQKRTGRPSAMTPRLERSMVRSVLKFRRQRIMDIARDSGVSTQTARSTLHRLGYHGRVAKKKPYLSKIHIRKRKQWADEMLDKDEDYWENVIFSDESKFELFGNKRHVIVWRRRGKSIYHLV